MADRVSDARLAPSGQKRAN